MNSDFHTIRDVGDFPLSLYFSRSGNTNSLPSQDTPWLMEYPDRYPELSSV